MNNLISISYTENMTQAIAGIQSKTNLTRIDFNDILNIYKFAQKLPLKSKSFQIDFVLATKGKLGTVKGSVCPNMSTGKKC